MGPEGLAEIITRKSRQNQRVIYLLADEPYRFLSFDGQEVPALLPLYPYTVVVSSFSKNLSLAGERIGYVLLNPRMPKVAELHAGLVLTNRILVPAVPHEVPVARDVMEHMSP